MAGPITHVKVAGAWKRVNKIHVRVAGVWKGCNKVYNKVGGVWKLIHTQIPPILTYINKAVSPTNNTVYTFLAHPIGTASATRLVIIGVFGANNAGAAAAAPTGLTIGGVAATNHGSALGTGTNEVGITIFSLVVAAGTTADIIATWADGQVRCGIVSFTLTGYISATPVANPSNIADPANNVGAAFTVGLAQVGLVIAAINAAPATCTWANATESDDFVVDTGNAAMSCAIVPAATVATVTATFTASDALAIRGAVWG